MFQIEGRVDGHWETDAVGRDTEANRFNALAEAEEMIPQLAKVFDCDESDFRVVVIANQ